MESNKIYRALKHKIVWMELEPEKALNLTELAEEFGVSRTPVKEALLLLQGGGWVNRHGSHFMVTPLSLNLIKETAEIRNVLETRAALWAMERISPAELEALQQIESDIQALQDDADRRRLIELDVRFHNLLYEAAKNTQLSRILHELLNHYLRFWLWRQSPIKRDEFFSATVDIIRAIREKDAAALESACVSHVRKSVTEITLLF